MQAQFPPVDIVYERKVRSHWREFEFMLHQVQQATETTINLNTVISKWDEISKNLAESSRKRKLKIENAFLS